MSESSVPTESSWRLRARSLFVLLLLFLALALAAGWYRQREKLDQFSQAFARRLSESEAAMREEAVRARQTQEVLRDVAAKYAVLESKFAETQSQQLALEQMYQALSRAKDDSALLEVEQLAETASQQLQLAGNVSGAVSALQVAEARLARDSSPRLVPLRRAIGRDLERLRAVPAVDTTGLALKLDRLLEQADQWPLLSTSSLEPSSVETATPVPAPAAPPSQALQSEWWQGVAARLQRLGGQFVQDARQLVSLRRVDEPEALLLSPKESYFVRENLKLHLLHARMALLARQDQLFRRDLEAVQTALTRYFDTRHPSLVVALESVNALRAAPVVAELPMLTDTLSVVKVARTAQEKQ